MYQFFKVVFTNQQIATLNITTLQIKLNTFLGRAELYGSTKNQNPIYSNAEYSSSSLSHFNYLEVDVTGMDLTQLNLYLSVYGGGAQSTFLLKIDAIYSTVYPSCFY